MTIQRSGKTVAAVSTANADGAIAVVRLSGADAIAVAGRIFSPANGKPLSDFPGNTAVHGWFSDEKGRFDEGIALLFRAPKSYTGEDMAELSCHGSRYLASRLLSAAVAAGASPAGPGEFTKRAFLNGKLDLSAAEAVAELIAAKSERSARLALSRREGALGREAVEIASALTDVAARLAVWSDYPEEEDSPEVTPDGLLAAFRAARERLLKLLAGSREAGLYQNGVRIAIAGSPNVGKSTLMNLLSGEETSIVTDLPGTTRDVVSAAVAIGGVPATLYDTAGIRESDDPVERIGVGRARSLLAQSDLVLLVLDGSRPLADEDRLLMGELRGRPLVTVINKTDLPQRVFPQDAGGAVEISAATGKGAGRLREAVREALGLVTDESLLLIANERQADCVRRSAESLGEAIGALESGVTLDAVSVLLDAALAPLLELSGRGVGEAVLEKVFSSFCVGK